MPARPERGRDVVSSFGVINIGGPDDYLLDNLAGLGVPVIPDPASESKDVRAERVLDLYQRKPSVVVHTERWSILEQEMTAFPTKGVNDDALDAVVGAVLFLLRRSKRGRKKSASYA